MHIPGKQHAVPLERLCFFPGICSEVYPITKQKLESSYELTGSKYSHSFEYDPSIRNIVTGEKISVLNFANGVISTGKSRILAKKLDHHVKLFTAWDDEKYYSGTPGDYIAVREDDEHDIYIISGELFDPSIVRIHFKAHRLVKIGKGTLMISVEFVH